MKLICNFDNTFFSANSKKKITAYFLSCNVYRATAAANNNTAYKDLICVLIDLYHIVNIVETFLENLELVAS